MTVTGFVGQIHENCQPCGLRPTRNEETIFIRPFRKEPRTSGLFSPWRDSLSFLILSYAHMRVRIHFWCTKYAYLITAKFILKVRTNKPSVACDYFLSPFMRKDTFRQFRFHKEFRDERLRHFQVRLRWLTWYKQEIFNLVPGYQLIFQLHQNVLPDYLRACDT